MKYLSTYENTDECKEFLYQNNFISEEEKNDEEYDLLRWFEGDPDWIDIKQPRGYYDRVFFAICHADHKYEGDSVTLTTAECSDDTEAVASYVEGKKRFTRYECETWGTFESDTEHEFKVAYRGGMGCIYRLEYA